MSQHDKKDLFLIEMCYSSAMDTYLFLVQPLGHELIKTKHQNRVNHFSLTSSLQKTKKSKSPEFLIMPVPLKKY